MKIYPDCNFTKDLCGWSNSGSLKWLAIKYTSIGRLGNLTGRQGMI